MYGCLFMLCGSDAADGFRESKKTAHTKAADGFRMSSDNGSGTMSVPFLIIR